MAEEEWDRLAQGQPASKVQILNLLRQGFTHQEIADKIGINEKTIRRLIRQLHPGLA
jgi:DNA-binding NarL/FixJ family response regulator